jgi:hypothetical protein
MDIQAAKAAAESQMLLRRQILIAQKDNLMVKQRPADFGNHGVVEWLAQIDPRELGAESSGDAAHVKCPIAHPASLTGLNGPVQPSCVLRDAPSGRSSA